ncbi:unnamed protein product [Urochloa decumbens]|uniref:Transcription repressor n=1 Tax=Urochloa decumbens TaxID=240449 RepID=A0ABC9CXS7_9POAL
MPPSQHPPHPHSQSYKLKRRHHHPAAMAKKGLVAILYKLRDVHRPPSPSPPSPSTPSAHHAHQRCYPPPPSAWPWPSCRHPRTSSFRAPATDAATVFRTANTVYDANSSDQFLLLRSPVDEEAACAADRSPIAALPAGEAAAVEEEAGAEEEKEMELRETAVVRGVRSERLFFDPAGAEFLPKQVTQEAAPPERGGKNGEAAAVASVDSEDPAAGKAEPAAGGGGGAVVVTVESRDPYGDFRASMAEMVAAHGLRDWEALEELLVWYLKLNAKGLHAAIVGAFIDLLVTMHPQAPAASPPTMTSPSPSSSCITFEEYSSATTCDEEEQGKS